MLAVCKGIFWAALRFHGTVRARCRRVDIGGPGWAGGTLIEIMIIAVSKLWSLCDRAISRLSHSSVRSMYVTANANTLTAAHTHILDYTQHRGTDPGYFWRKRKKHELSFLFFVMPFLAYVFCDRSGVIHIHAWLSAVPPPIILHHWFIQAGLSNTRLQSHIAKLIAHLKGLWLLQGLASFSGVQIECHYIKW